ncbi:hypothetical protein BSPLISOX_2219, partial [uncultured Gammaproteobacteria bacterium]
QININSQNLNILSSQDTNNTKSNTKHKNLNVSYTVYGTNSGGLSGSISRDSSTSNSQQTTHHNTSLTAANINLNTTQNTKIKGANLQATNQLNLNTKNLEVSSVQNKHKAKTRSQGASLGIGSSGVSSVGFNQSKADENSKTVLLTSMTAKQVNINTQAHTQLTGSLIAATDTGDKDGNDNGQLSLTTNSLNASSLNTTTNNKSNSIGLNAGGNANTNSAKLNRVSLDYTNNKHNSKTKVLATLGSGNIQIADINQSNSKSKSNSNSKSKPKSKSSTKLLNRDIKDTEVDIYNIASHKGLKGEIDTRLLTKNGRIQIAKDIKKSGMITSAIQQIVNTDRAELKDFLNEVDKLHKTDEAVTAKIANNPELAKALTDPNLTPTQKQQLAKELVSGVMVELGYTQAVDVKLVADSQDNRKGHHGEDNNIY